MQIQTQRMGNVALKNVCAQTNETTKMTNHGWEKSIFSQPVYFTAAFKKLWWTSALF